MVPTPVAPSQIEAAPNAIRITPATMPPISQSLLFRNACLMAPPIRYDLTNPVTGAPA